MSSKTYRINEMFYSLQGEGVRSGTPNIFIRFSKCNLKCRVEPGPLSPGGFDCDTEFESGKSMSVDEIIGNLSSLSSAIGNVGSVIFTGGEPGLQLDENILKVFKSCAFFTCVETNGTIDFSKFQEEGLIDWVTCSPKVAEHAIRCLKCSEVKYVRAKGQEIPVTKVVADHYLISPAFSGNDLPRENLEWCINLVKQNPRWRLSMQLHKFWQVR